MRGPRSMLRSLLIGVSLVSGGCVEFGLDVPPPEPKAQPTAEVPEDCEEGPAEPDEAALEIRFLTLDVDQRAVTIAPGEVILWTNGSAVTHTASAGAPGADLPVERGGFDSGNLPGGGTQWAYRFCDPRTIVWYCRTHPAMMFGYLITIGNPGGNP